MSADKSTRKVVIRPVSSWPTVAAEYKRAGCKTASDFLLIMMLSCIRVPAHELASVRRVWSEEE